MNARLIHVLDFFFLRKKEKKRKEKKKKKRNWMGGGVLMLPRRREKGRKKKKKNKLSKMKSLIKKRVCIYINHKLYFSFSKFHLTCFIFIFIFIFGPSTPYSSFHQSSDPHRRRFMTATSNTEKHQIRKTSAYLISVK